MKYQAVLFDLDGTLLDTLEDLADSLNAVFAAHLLPPRTIDEVRAFVGNGIAKLIERAVPRGTAKEEIAAVLADFKTYYAAHCADKTRPYAGVCDLLAALRRAGIKTAMISNKGDFAVQALAKDYFGGLFDTVLGERDGVPRKPAPDMVRHTLTALGVAPANAVYIGDSDVDVQTARNAGLDGIFVTWGFRGADVLRAQGANTLVDSASELRDLLLAD